MISGPDRQEALTLIDDAVRDGASLDSATNEIGITTRTYYRWKKQLRL